jgi:uncharacterized OB-fold protein
MATADKQIPRPTEFDLEFFQALASTGQMHVQKCTDCGDFHHPPRVFCPQCFSGAYVMEGVSGRGTVYSHTISHYTTEKAWKDEVPWATVVVELDEGPRLVGTARGFSHNEIKIGVRVRVVPEKVNDDFAYLWVEKDEEVA